MMKDRAYMIAVAILGVVAAVMVVWALLMLSQSHKVDCDVVLKDLTGTGYKPVPKQCEKGE